MNEPLTLSEEEVREISGLKEIQELWGATNREDMIEFLRNSCSVKFNFISGTPGYCGDLYIIQGDSIDSTILPVRLIRDEGKLIILEVPPLE